MTETTEVTSDNWPDCPVTQDSLFAWAAENSTTNRFGSTEYPKFVCHIMNLFDPRVRQCENECCWEAPFGWVPEAGCAIHD